MPRFTRRGPWATLVVAILIIAGFISRFDRFDAGGDFEEYHNKVFTVIEVVDGDTVDINIPDGKFPDTRIRLWGVDTPEVAGSRDVAMHFGDRASQFTKQTIGGKKVRVLLSSQRTRDKYSRLLAYLELPETGESFNALLIKEGMAYADWRFDHPFKTEYKSLERKARKDQRGLWAKITPDQMPPWRERMERELDYGP